MVKRFSPHGLLPVFCYNEGQKCWDSFISEGILMYFIQLLPPRTKIYPNKCWISYRANNGLCSGTTLNGGGRVISTFQVQLKWSQGNSGIKPSFSQVSQLLLSFIVGL